jgi:type IV secretory pathway VirB2 component (pilin)
MASIMVFNNHQNAQKAAFTCGLLVLIWIATQMSIIGYVSWMQPTIVIVGIIILFLTYLLPKNYA